MTDPLAAVLANGSEDFRRRNSHRLAQATGPAAVAAVPSAPGVAVADRDVRDAAEPARRSKYGERRTVGPDPAGGTRLYSSAREARRAVVLMDMKRRGEIADFYPQVSLEFGQAGDGSPRRLVVDFLVVEAWLPDGRFAGRFEDPKGADTLHSKAKRAALQARGLHVRLL